MRLRYITLCIVVLMAQLTQSQDLSKEITIEKEIVPEKRNASRLMLSPAVSLPVVSQKQLTFSEYGSSALVAPQLAFLEPAAYADSLTAFPYRGYVDLGYFPIYNTALSAGYRIIDKQSTLLNTWLQYNGKVYDGEILNEPIGDVTMRSHEASIGLNFKQKVGAVSQLMADVAYSYNYFRVPFGVYRYDSQAHYNQSVNHIETSLGWKSATGKIDYDANVEYGYFDFAKHGALYSSPEIMNAMSPVRENRFALKGQLSYIINECARVGADVNAHYLDYNRDYVIVEDSPSLALIMKDLAQDDYGIVSLTPRLDYAHETFSARIGARVDVCINSGRALYIAPDVNVHWKPVSVLSVYGRLGGGQYVNTMSQLYNDMQHMLPMRAYSHSSLPITADMGVTLGPWRGVALEAYGRYAKADDWLMPMIDRTVGFYSPCTVEGMMFGASARYNYRNIVELKVVYETAPQGGTKGYYAWRDRAHNVVDASLVITPIKPLDITVVYQYRSDRQAEAYYYKTMLDLDDVSNLSLGGVYRFTPSLSVFARFENILDADYHLLSGLPAQGFSGLIGVGYKF